MQIDTSVQEGTVTMALSGRLDTITQGLLAEEMETVFQREKADLVFDMTSLDYISSAGLRVLLTAQKKINAQGTSMKIVGAKHEIKEIFDMTGFSSIMTIE